MRTVVPLGAPDAPTASVEIRLVDPTAPTVLAFAGMGMGLQMPIAEFAGVLEPLWVNVVFVKDLQRCWYQHGVTGLGTTIAQSAHRLADLVPTGSAVAGTVGTSSGGTAAVLFGVELDVPVIMAFSPRTLVDVDAVARWREVYPEMPEIDLAATTTDLRTIIEQRPGTRIDVHYGTDNDADAVQVARIADLDGVRVIGHPTSWHPSAAWLRDRGELGRTLRAGFGLELRPGADYADRPIEDRATDQTPTGRDWRPGPLWRAVRARLTEAIKPER